LGSSRTRQPSPLICVDPLLVMSTDEGFAFTVTVTTVDGGHMVIRGLGPDDHLAAVWELVGAHFSLSRMSGVLCCGDRKFCDDDEEVSLRQLKVVSGDTIMFIKQPREAWLWNPALLRMLGTESQQEFETKIIGQAIASLSQQHYRSQAFALEQDQTRDAFWHAAETQEDSAAFQRGDHHEGEHIWELYESRRYSLHDAVVSSQDRSLRVAKLLSEPPLLLESVQASTDESSKGYCKEQNLPAPFGHDGDDERLLDMGHEDSGHGREDSAKVVLDMGGFWCKAGFAGDDAPQVMVRSVVGAIAGNEDALIGKAALGQGRSATLIYPMEHGIVTDWAAMEKIWRHMFCNELHIDPKLHRLILTEAPLNPKTNRERMISIAFESFNVPAITVETKGVLALYSSGRTTGIVAHCGECASHTTPIYEGHLLPHAILRTDVSGRSVTENLVQLLVKRGFSFISAAHCDNVCMIKEKICMVQEDANVAPEFADVSCSCDLPDAHMITLGKERFDCTEVLFSPSATGRHDEGFHSMVFQTLMKCPIDVRKDMYSNIVLSGGTTLLPGFHERLHNELSALLPPHARVTVVAPPERMCSVWIGASIVGSIEGHGARWFTKSDYDVCGADVSKWWPKRARRQNRFTRALLTSF